MAALLQLLRHPSQPVRQAMYEMLEGAITHWHDGFAGHLVAMLLFGLADEDLKCQAAAFKSLLALQKRVAVQQIVLGAAEVLNKFTPNSNPVLKMKLMDDLATRVATQCPQLSATLRTHKYIFFVWKLMYTDQVTVPIRAWWPALIYSRMHSNPPEQAPANFVGVFGMMQLLKRSLSSTDTHVRLSACYACVRCCFNGPDVSFVRVQEAVSLVCELLPKTLPSQDPQFASSVSAVAKIQASSALLIVKLLVMYKIQHVSAFLLQRFHAVFTEYLEMDVTPVQLRLVTLEAVEVFLMTRPVTCAAMPGFLDRARDAVRRLVPHSSQLLRSVARRVYQLLYRVFSLHKPSVSSSNFTYLRSDLEPALNKRWQSEADPLLSKLSKAQLKEIAIASLGGMGAMKSSDLAPSIIQELVLFLHRADPGYREAALEALLAQLLLLERDGTGSKAHFIALPLVADPCLAVRHSFQRFLRGIPTTHDHRAEVLTAEGDDAKGAELKTLTSADPRELSADKVVQQVMVFPLNIDDGQELPYLSLPTGYHVLADDLRETPAVSEKLLERIIHVVKTRVGTIPESMLHDITYHLDEFKGIEHLNGVAMLVVSQLGVVAKSVTQQIIDTLIYRVSVAVTPSTLQLVRACAFGLANIAEHLPEWLAFILERFARTEPLHEGDFIALQHLSRLVDSSAAHNIVHRVMPLVTSKTTSLEIRRCAIELVSVLVLKAGDDDMTLVMTSIGDLLDTTQDAALQRVCQQQLARFLSRTGMHHVVVQRLLHTMKQGIASHDADVRYRSLMTLRIFVGSLDVDTIVDYAVLLLADPVRRIREGMIGVLVSGMLPHVGVFNDALRVLVRTQPTDQTDKPFQLAGIGAAEEATARQQQAPIFAVPMPDDDPENKRFLSSERYRAMTSFFGVEGAVVSSEQVAPVTAEVAAVITSDVDVKTIVRANLLPVMRELLRCDSTLGLKLLQRLESNVQADRELATEQEGAQMLLTLEVLIQVIGACDGLRDDLAAHLDIVHNFLSQCSKRADDVRAKIFANLEKWRFLYERSLYYPVADSEQYRSAHSYNKLLHEAAVDTQKAAQLQKERTSMDLTLASQNKLLRDLNLLLSRCVNGLGSTYSASLSLPAHDLVRGVRQLAELLDNDHRGVRSYVCQAIADIAEVHAKSSPDPTLSAALRVVWERALRAVQEDLTNSLRRKKADLIFLIARLLTFTESAQRKDAINRLIHAWDDPDGVVKQVAIEMVQYLGETGLPELRQYTVREGSTPPELMSQIMKRINNPMYRDKEPLNRLLKWYFQHSAVSGVSEPLPA
eukprot:TRINITY_DN1747_c1_g5_i2.p1 TRINITY_DN1747_c1_g5~~TRINITY_DN1747_c1_g5_i2.p1  ORF type:complete len:1304 (-),score=354.73 TRINITY_DN1747_c1_g5_i2:87-3998(-)